MTVVDKYVNLPAIRLYDIFRYDHFSGVLVRSERPELGKSWNKRYGGKPIVNKDNKGYLVASITENDFRANFYVHVIAWAMMNLSWPPKGMNVDHRDNDFRNNRYRNLRLCTVHENRMNTGVARSSTGFKGVYTVSQTKKFVVMITVSGKSIPLGYTHTAEEGARRYDAAAIKHFGEFAKTNAAMGLL